MAVKSEKYQLSRSWSPDLTFGLIRTAMVWGSRGSMKKVFKACFSCCYRLICTQLCYSAQIPLPSENCTLHCSRHTKNHFLHQPSAPAQRPTTFGSIEISENHAAHAPKSLFHHHNHRIVNSIKNTPKPAAHQRHMSPSALGPQRPYHSGSIGKSHCTLSKITFSQPQCGR